MRDHPVLEPAADLRKTLRLARAALSPTECQRHSQRICVQAMRFLQTRNTRTVAAYLPVGNEIDLKGLIVELDAMGLRIVLPRIHRSLPGRMRFLQWRPGDRLVRNRYGIDEPVASAGAVWRREIDVVLLPLLAFDAQCNRLGMGAGYYDRYFAACSSRARGLSPLLIGVAHSIQELPQLQRNPWDVALDAVITENGIRRCR